MNPQLLRACAYGLALVFVVVSDTLMHLLHLAAIAPLRRARPMAQLVCAITDGLASMVAIAAWVYVCRQWNGETPIAAAIIAGAVVLVGDLFRVRRAPPETKTIDTESLIAHALGIVAGIYLWLDGQPWF